MIKNGFNTPPKINDSRKKDSRFRKDHSNGRYQKAVTISSDEECEKPIWEQNWYKKKPSWNEMLLFCYRYKIFAIRWRHDISIIRWRHEISAVRWRHDINDSTSIRQNNGLGNGKFYCDESYHWTCGSPSYDVTGGQIKMTQKIKFYICMWHIHAISDSFQACDFWKKGRFNHKYISDFHPRKAPFLFF